MKGREKKGGKIFTVKLFQETILKTKQLRFSREGVRGLAFQTSALLHFLENYEEKKYSKYIPVYRASSLLLLIIVLVLIQKILPGCNGTKKVRQLPQFHHPKSNGFRGTVTQNLSEECA